MRGRVWLSCALLGGCIDIPPFPENQGDRDGDGWPATSINDDAEDCNDDDPDINPGAIDDPSTPEDEDCLNPPSSDPIPGVLATAGGMSSNDLRIEFNTDSRMPSALFLGDDDLLGRNPSACEFNNEEGLGIAVYPSFGVSSETQHATQGTLAVLSTGPAYARVRVEWQYPFTGCAQPMNEGVGGVVDFIMLPYGRLIRHDAITIAGDAPLTMCTGPGGCQTTPQDPVFTTYATFPSWIGGYEVDEGGFNAWPLTADPLPGGPSQRLCLLGQMPGPAASIAKLGMTWRGTPMGLRARDAAGARAVVFDWNTGSPLLTDTYEATTAIFAQITEDMGCTPEMWRALFEFSSPPLFTNQVEFRPALGMYVPLAPVTGNRLAFTAMQDSQFGFAVLIDNLGDDGVTVWRAGNRLAAGNEYHVQREGTADARRYVVFIPFVGRDQQIIIAGPGGEPPEA